MGKASEPPKRWARDYLFDILRDLGIRYIFGVPGTYGIPIIDGTSYAENEVRYIECLHETLAVGVAMGYARMSGKPGVLVVPVTPGSVSGIGHLSNAWPSKTPLVVLSCQPQNEVLSDELPLASTAMELARQHTKWAHEVRVWQEVPLALQRAFKEALAPPNGPVFLSLPWELMMRRIGPDDRIPGVTSISEHFTGDPLTVRNAAELLAAAKNPILIAGDGVGYANAWTELQELAELLGAPVLLQTFSSVANFPNDDPHWQGELLDTQAGVQATFDGHDVAFLCGCGAKPQITPFRYSDGPLIPPSVRQIHLTNNTGELAKNDYSECAIFGDVKATLPQLNALIADCPPAEATERNDALRALDAVRAHEWTQYLELALSKNEIWGVVIADALRDAIADLGLGKKFVYVHEAVADPAPFHYYLPFGSAAAAPISYYCAAGGAPGGSMPASLGVKLEPFGWQRIETQLVVNAVGDGSSLFYPQIWWTAAQHELAVLYILTNDGESDTPRLALQETVAAYGSAPGYEWAPKTPDPEYLRARRPQVDVVQLAKALGGDAGEVVERPKDVSAAVRRGVEHVINKRRSYILDMRTSRNSATGAEATDERYAEQPPLDVFHRERLRKGSPRRDLAPAPSVPILP